VLALNLHCVGPTSHDSARCRPSATAAVSAAECLACVSSPSKHFGGSRCEQAASNDRNAAIETQRNLEGTMPCVGWLHIDFDPDEVRDELLKKNRMPRSSP
jgi:hypothetical protein